MAMIGNATTCATLRDARERTTEITKRATVMRRTVKQRPSNSSMLLMPPPVMLRILVLMPVKGKAKFSSTPVVPFWICYSQRKTRLVVEWR